MYVKVNSTRHTRIGTLRRGQVLTLTEKMYDTKDAYYRAMDVIKPLMEGANAPFQKITAKEAKASATSFLGAMAPSKDS